MNIESLQKENQKLCQVGARIPKETFDFIKEKKINLSELIIQTVKELKFNEKLKENAFNPLNMERI